MISSSDLKKHHISILHYCNKGVRSSSKMHHKANIPLRTIYCNSNKLNQLNSLKYQAGNSQPRVLSSIGTKAIRKCIRHKNEITFNQIKENLSSTYHSSVSISTIRRDLHAYVCKNVLLKSTYMLMTHDKKATCRMT
jgi:D-aminopeptidase